MPPRSRYDRYQKAKGGIQKLLKYDFRNDRLLRKALRADGALDRGSQQKKENQKLLALVGDAVMDIVLSLVAVRSNYTSKRADDYRKALLCNENLSKVGRKHGFHNMDEENPAMAMELSEKMMGTVVEAIVGALFLDCDMKLDKVEAAMSRLRLLPRT